jgi:hypothetical protein
MYRKDQYYTASEAIAKLGMSKAMFHRQVVQGLIPKITPANKKHNLYPKRDIDALASMVDVALEKHGRIEFTKSSPADQREEMKIGIACFGSEYITPLLERVEFQRKSEFTFWSLKVDGVVVGYVSMFRFPPNFLDDILTGRKIEREITVREVIPFSRVEPFDIYIDVMAVDPTLPPHERHLYAGIIAQRFARTILGLLDNGYEIRVAYTVTATKEGDNLVRRAGFKLMEGKSLASGRIAYKFPLDDEGRAKLEEKSGKKQHV